MSSIIKQNEELITYIKSIIFKYCPYVEDRRSILGNYQSPQMDIEITIHNNETQIMFLFGNGNFKSSIPEQVTIPCVIEFYEISEIIDFILSDHEVIKNINLYNSSFELNFAINWTDQSVKGINCDDIGVKLEINNIELLKQYLYLLFQKYYLVLEYTPSFKRIKKEYINNIKQLYFNTLDKTQLISLLNSMNEDELKELLYNLDNDIFIKYTTDGKSQTKVKKLFIENPDKNS